MFFFVCLCYDISSLLVIRAMVWFSLFHFSLSLFPSYFSSFFSLSFRSRFRVNIIIVGKLGCLFCFALLPFPALRLTIGNILLIYGMAFLTFRGFCLPNSARFFFNFCFYFVGGSFSWITPSFLPSVSIFLVCWSLFQELSSSFSSSYSSSTTHYPSLRLFKNYFINNSHSVDWITGRARFLRFLLLFLLLFFAFAGFIFHSRVLFFSSY